MTVREHDQADRTPTEDLRAALEFELQHQLDAPVSIVAFHRALAEYRSSFALEELHVDLDSGPPLALMFKDFGSLLDDAIGIKPAFVVDPGREIEVYRRILVPHQIGPRCYGSVADDSAGRHWLFVEMVPGRLLWQEGEFEVWLQTARWLARMHALVPRPDSPMIEQARLLRYDGAYCGRWPERAVRYASGNAGASMLLRHVADRYSRVTERIAALPVSFVHGEFYASNVLVTWVDEDLRVCPVDWEMAGVGSGLLDLAALVSGHWEADERRAFARAYFDELRGGPDAGRFDEFHESLQWCRLHIAVQWLGWSERWLPPKEHAHHWLQDVAELADSLNL